MTQPAHVVVVGAGHAGGTVSALLRQYGWQGAITLIGQEPVPPYQRPPLSKAWLTGQADDDALELRPAAFYAANGIALRLYERAVSIDPPCQAVVLASGERVTYDHLIVATGARPRELDCPCDFAGQVLVLRTRADAACLKAALTPRHRLAIIGGGYIGLEVAASAQASGAVCTVIEREGRVMPRVASTVVSAFFQRQHAAQGVRLILGAGVEALESAGVRLRDGRLAVCDTVLVGTGAVAEDGLARAAGLDCENGIVVDETARSSDPRIYAIGDCTCRDLPPYGNRVRLESVANAVEQAKQAAAALCGRKAPAQEVPWFWSDQYKLRLQIAGLPFGVDRTVVRGNPDSGSFAVFHLGAEGTVQAVEAVNAAPEFMAGRMLIARRRAVRAERLADPVCPMQEVVA